MAEFLEGVLLECLWLQLLFKSDTCGFSSSPQLTWYFYLCLIGHQVVVSVALAGSDGRVLGGCVAGMLMAATPIQVRYMWIFFLTPAHVVFLHVSDWSSGCGG
jgi:hypothetical protein